MAGITLLSVDLTDDAPRATECLNISGWVLVGTSGPMSISFTSVDKAREWVAAVSAALDDRAVVS